MIIIAVTTEVRNSVRQVWIARWLNEEISSIMLQYEAFRSYNPDYPEVEQKPIKFGDS